MANAEYSGIQFTVSTEASSAVKGFEELKKALLGFRPAAIEKTASAVSKLVNAVNRVHPGSAQGLTAIAEGLNALKTSSRFTLSDKTLVGIMDLCDIAANISPDVVSRLNDLGTALKTFDGLKTPNVRQMTAAVNAATRAAERQREMELRQKVDPFGTVDDGGLGDMLEDSTEKTGGFLESLSRLQAVGSTLSDTLSPAAGWVSAFTAAVKGGVSVMSRFYKSIVAIGSALKDKLFGGLTTFAEKVSQIGSAIARIALYRGMRSVIKMFTEGFSEGLENLYYWSEAAGNQFFNSMNQIATASNYAKNSLAAMAAPIYNALAPVFDAIINKAVALMNVLNQLFAFIGGQSTWVKAEKGATRYAKALGSSGSAAKSAKKQLDLYLASFDELHRIPSDKDTGSGSGGSGGSVLPDYASMFTEQDLDKSMFSWLDKADWSGYGRAFAAKLNILVNTADAWITGVFEPWAMKFSGQIATFLNGMVEGLDFAALGRTMADALNAIMRPVNNFFATFDWEALGSQLALGLAHMINRIDSNALGTWFSNKLNAVLKTAKGFIGDFSQWASEAGSKMGSAIMAWVSSIDYESASYVFSEGLNMIGSMLSGFVESIDWEGIKNTMFYWMTDSLFNFDAQAFGESIGSLLNNLIGLAEGIDWYMIGVKVGEMLTGIDWIGIIGKVIKVVLTGTGEFLLGAIPTILPSVVSGLITFAGQLGAVIPTILADVGKVLVQNFTDFANESTDGFAGGILDFISGIGGWMWDNFVSPIVSAVEGLFGIKNGSSTVTQGQGSAVIQGFLDGVSKKVGTAVSAVGKFGSDVLGKFSGLVNKDKFAGFASNISEGFSGGIWSYGGKALSAMSTWANNLLSRFTGVFDIHSPSRKMRWASHMIIQGVENPIDSAGTDVMSNWATRLITAFSPVPEFVQAAMDSALVAVNSTMPELVSSYDAKVTLDDTSEDALANFGNVVVDAFGNTNVIVELDGDVVYKSVVKRNNEQVADTGTSEFAF